MNKNLKLKYFKTTTLPENNNKCVLIIIDIDKRQMLQWTNFTNNIVS